MSNESYLVLEDKASEADSGAAAGKKGRCFGGDARSGTCPGRGTIPTHG